MYAYGNVDSSNVALITDRFDAMCAFYGPGLGGVPGPSWGRTGARGARFVLYGLPIEILDNRAEKEPFALGSPNGRVWISVRPPDEAAFRKAAALPLEPAVATSWGPRIIRLRDPDGTPVAVMFFSAD